MKAFWDGFEKRAASVIGVMPGVTSGLRTTKSFGKIRQAHPESGISIGPRATPGPVPSPTPIHASKANTAGVKRTSTPQATVPKPLKQYGKGLQGSYV